MEDILFIKKFYYYLIAFICILSIISFTSYLNNKLWKKFISILVIFFSIFTVYYIGGRERYIGVDTRNYERIFIMYKNVDSFFIRKDPFFDFLNYSFSHFLDFQIFLFFCAILYILGALYGLKKIFRENYYLPFLIFLISPYFFNAGINVMRSGVASSLFLVGLGVYYDKGKTWKVILWFTCSVLFHFSMFVPMLFFLITRFIKNTKIIFFVWLSSIVLGILNINIISNILGIIDIFTDRASSYVTNIGKESSWIDFAIFGFFPVVFSVYNILVLKYKDDFYRWLVNAYMLIHIPYIILINTQYASRIGYLAEFMLPIILFFPLLVHPKLIIKYSRLKLCVAIFCVFMIKAYKVLII